MKEREIISRGNFGSGRAGQRAFKLISQRVACEGDNCLQKANQTLDFHVFTGLEQIPLCDNCLPLAKKKVQQELTAQGHFPRLTTNGRARG